MRHCPECCLWYCYFPCYQQGCCWLCSSYWLLQERVVAAAAPGRVVVDAATGLLLQLLLYLVNVFFGHTAPPTQPRPLALFETEPITHTVKGSCCSCFCYLVNVFFGLVCMILFSAILSIPPATTSCGLNHWGTPYPAFIKPCKGRMCTPHAHWLQEKTCGHPAFVDLFY